MNCILDIINKRSIPGVLIIDADYRLLQANREALEIFPAMQNCTPGEAERPTHIPHEIVNLCERLKIRQFNSIHGNVPGCEILDPTGSPCSLRAFFIGNPAEGEEPKHIMVLMERIVEKREVDFAKAKKDYGLSKREVEVLQCVCQGLHNREIAETKFISEYTVKNHIRKIMRSMGVKSRCEILATLR